MFSLNRVHVIGYQTQPVQVRQTPSGTSVTDLNLVVPYMFRSENGETLQGKSFHIVTLWGPMADVAGQFIRPGGHIFIGGRMQTDSWDDEKTGEKRNRTKIVAQEMILLDPKDGQRDPPAGAQKTLGAVNRADVIGNVTRDPEVRATTSGQKVLTLGVATNDRWRDKASGEMKERSEFHNIVVWGDLAAEVGSCVRKGQRIFATGRVQTRSFTTPAGVKRSVTEIVADAVSVLGVRSNVAQESLRDALSPGTVADAAASGALPAETTAEATSAEADAANPAVAVLPEIRYESDVKVEDLPF